MYLSLRGLFCLKNAGVGFIFICGGPDVFMTWEGWGPEAFLTFFLINPVSFLIWWAWLLKMPGFLTSLHIKGVQNELYLLQFAYVQAKCTDPMGFLTIFYIKCVQKELMFWQFANV
jgi:hypothetical protein